jgi:pimeloyl-ACP methyl ester carboxylesterase
MEEGPALFDDVNNASAVPALFDLSDGTGVVGKVSGSFLNSTPSPSSLLKAKRRGTRVGYLAVAIMFSFSFLFAAPVDYERVGFKNREGTRFSAFYHAPERNNPVVVMLHGLGSAKEEWLGFCQELSRRGWGWFIYDARGHGETSLTKGEDGAPNGYKYFEARGTGSEWEKMIDDVGSALDYLDKDKGIKKSRINLMGASLGANVVLNYAALTRFSGNVVLLSPGLNYQEIKAQGVIQKLPGKNILLVAHPGDAYSFSSCTLMSQAMPAMTFWSDVKQGHGVQMLDSKLMGRLIDWLNAK